MPPAISDSEDETFDNMVKLSSQKKNGKKVTESADEEEEEEVLNVESGDEKDDEDDDGAEEPEEMYTVEKILTHQFNEKGDILFQIKWEGYEKVGDRTWEPEENLDTAKELVEEYFSKLGGREKVMAASKKGGKAGAKRGRQSNVGTPASTKKAKTTRQSATRSATPEESHFQPPSGSWEEEVKAIDAAEGAQGQVQVYITWRDGHKTQHPLDVCYKRCPQKMLKFFESHLSFITKSRRLGAQTNVSKGSSRKRKASSIEDDA